MPSRAALWHNRGVIPGGFMINMPFRRVAAALALSLAASTATASQPDFAQWLKGVRADAIAAGVSSATADAALANVKPIPKIIELDRKQPEKRLSFATYLERVVTEDRIAKGRRLLKENRAELDHTAAKYGVPPEVVVALWGVESSYGGFKGSYPVVDALATLAYDGRRSEYFRKELIVALKIVDEGHVALPAMSGSWAGAMGQTQFMPSSFVAYAQDENGDGRKDIWESLPDVFGSASNYLAQAGWKAGEPWGQMVSLPKGFDKALIGDDARRGTADWARLGVRLKNGAPLPADGRMAWIVAPDGPTGPAYMAFDNYKVFLRWNRSSYFATSVGLLAERISAP